MIYGTMPKGERLVSPTATFGEVMGAEFEQSWTEGLLQSSIDRGKLERERGSTSAMFGPLGLLVDKMVKGATGTDVRDVLAPTEVLTKEMADERLKGTELSGKIKVPAEGMRKGELELLMSEKRKELARASILARASDDFGTSIGQFGAGLLANVADPANAALMFTPVVSQMRYAWMLGQSTSLAGRTGVRLGVGALEGAAGTAVAEPLIYSTQQEFQRNYTLLNSFLNVVMGSATGATLHSLGGGIRERVGRQTQTWRSMSEWIMDQKGYTRDLGARAPATLDDWKAMAFERDRGGRNTALSPEAYEKWLTEFSQRVPERLTRAEFEAWAKEFQGQPFFNRPYMRLSEGVDGDARSTAVDLTSSHLAEGKSFDGSTVWRYDRAEKRLKQHIELTQGDKAEMIGSITPDKFQPLGNQGEFGIAAQRIGLPIQGEKLPEAIVSSPAAIGDTVRWVRADGTDRLAGPGKVYAASSDGRYVYVDTPTGRQKGAIPTDEIEVTLHADRADRKWNTSLRWGDDVMDVSRNLSRADAEKVGREELARFYQAELGARATHEMEVKNAGAALAEETRLAGTPERDISYSEPKPPVERLPDATGGEQLASVKEIADPQIKLVEQQLNAVGKGDVFKEAMLKSDEELTRAKDAHARMAEYINCLMRSGL